MSLGSLSVVFKLGSEVAIGVGRGASLKMFGTMQCCYEARVVPSMTHSNMRVTTRRRLHS